MNEYSLLYSIVAILGIGLLIINYIKNNQNQSKIWSCFFIIVSLLITIKVFEQNEKIKSLTSDIERNDIYIDNLYSEIRDLKDDIVFYKKHIVFVNTGINVYHTLNCEQFDSTSFLAFNTENAVAQGYKPCARCNAPIAKGAQKTYVVYITRTGSKYHSKGCSYLKSSISISKSDAISQGYSACSRCNP